MVAQTEWAMGGSLNKEIEICGEFFVKKQIIGEELLIVLRSIAWRFNPLLDISKVSQCSECGYHSLQWLITWKV